MPGLENQGKLLQFNHLRNTWRARRCPKTVTVCQVSSGRLRSAPYGQR